jgi:formylglycine-generating enzyme required for sulfatase activity
MRTPNPYAMSMVLSFLLACPGKRVEPPGIKDSTGIQWVQIPAGTFEMGGEPAWHTDENPVHSVTLDAFEMSATEVTVGQYRRCVEAGHCSAPKNEHDHDADRPASRFNSSDDLPVVFVSWQDAQTYATWAGGRLPTEAEWEYAARGGESFLCSGSDVPEEVGWTSKNSGFTSHQVGTKKSNGFGLYDMSGNVFEWVYDWYDREYYERSPAKNPTGPEYPPPNQADNRVRRGGAWFTDGSYARVAGRGFFEMKLGNSATGFRIVRRGR